MGTNSLGLEDQLSMLHKQTTGKDRTETVATYALVVRPVLDAVLNLRKQLKVTPDKGLMDHASVLQTFLGQKSGTDMVTFSAYSAQEVIAETKYLLGRQRFLDQQISAAAPGTVAEAG